MGINLRIDGFIYSEKAKFPIGLELEKRAQSKSKYEPDIRENVLEGWNYWTGICVIGVLGYKDTAAWHSFLHLGFTRKEANEVISRCTLVARRCTYLMWLNRDNLDFNPSRLWLSVKID